MYEPMPIEHNKQATNKNVKQGKSETRFTDWTVRLFMAH